LFAALADRYQLGLDLPAALDREADGVAVRASGHGSVVLSCSGSQKADGLDGLRIRVRPRTTLPSTAAPRNREIASINDLPIKESERKYHWPLGRRPDSHPSLSELGL
jgi:hypothetical protein